MQDRTLAVTYRPIAALVPYAKNARTHSPEQITEIAASIGEFGWTNPILIDGQNSVIAGHGRLLAAQSLGMAEVPVVQLDGLTAAQKRALRLADNKLGLNAGWDEGLLRLELSDLRMEGFDLALTGFNEMELTGILTPRTDGLTDPDEVPEPPAEPVTQPGDVWLLGRHRLVCGDATSEVDVSLALAGVRPHLMVTDPPYGVSYNPGWRNSAFRSDGTFIGARAVGTVQNDDRADWSEAWALFPGDVAYVWHGWLRGKEVAASLEMHTFDVRAIIVWVKSHFVISRGHYHSQHESCWYAVRKGGSGHWAGDHKQTTVWQIDKPVKSETGHSTQKPVECMKRPIENNSTGGQAVYDPFVGSGTTIIAAEMTGRACHAIEISPAYCDTTVNRWQAFTGQEATLEATGQTYAEIAAERASPLQLPAHNESRIGK